SSTCEQPRHAAVLAISTQERAQSPRNLQPRAGLSTLPTPTASKPSRFVNRYSFPQLLRRRAERPDNLILERVVAIPDHELAANGNVAYGTPLGRENDVIEERRVVGAGHSRIVQIYREEIGWPSCLQAAAERSQASSAAFGRACKQAFRRQHSALQ